MQSNVYEPNLFPKATAPLSNNARWAGRVLSTVAVLFLVFDAVIKVARIQPVVDSFNLLGFPAELAPGIGILMLACLAIYLLPPTSVLGAILLTGYLGGAIALQLRVGAPPFSLVFPVIVAALLWGGLYLRVQILRTIIPLRR
jgi:hypothetical protein